MLEQADTEGFLQPNYKQNIFYHLAQAVLLVWLLHSGVPPALCQQFVVCPFSLFQHDSGLLCTKKEMGLPSLVWMKLGGPELDLTPLMNNDSYRLKLTNEGGGKHEKSCFCA